MADVTGSESRYDREALVAAMAARGLTATPRLVRDWTELGLIDNPNVRGLGRGRGVRATWPQSQAELFAMLLTHRQKGVSIADLAKLPVWIWLRWGDAFVPLRQVRRAMATWTRGVDSTSLEGSDRAASEVMQSLAAKSSGRTARKRFREVTASVQYTGRVDHEALLAVARGLIDPDGTGVPRGPAGATLTPEAYVEIVEARRIGIAGLPATSNAEFNAAREAWRFTVADYVVRRREYAADEDVGHLYSERTFSDEMNSSCEELALILGFRHISASAIPKGE